MALITRVSRLFRADLHAVLDRIEEPDSLLRQAVREMEEDVARDEQHIKRLVQEHGQVLARQADLEQSLNEIGEELDVCFDSGEENLARALIRRRLEAQRFLKFLSRKRNTLEETLSARRDRVVKNRSRLEGMRQKVEVLASEDVAARPEDSWCAPEITVRDEEVEVAYLREQQKRRCS